ncbi:MAG: F0F1 ATP synthase subunit B [Clostridia bacterium]|nr:F0F1 ATP synthase subunit B [Clostridia bacterium]
MEGPVSIDVGVLVWTAVNFLILFFILARVLWRPLLAMLEKREREVAENLEAAENAREEAVRFRAEYEERLREAQDRVEAMLREATQRAEALRAEVVEKAQAEAAEVLRRAEETIEREKAEALAQLRGEVFDLALAVARRVLEREVRREDHERLAEQFLVEVGGGR